MGTNECSQPASKSSWDRQDFGDVNMVLKMAHFHKSSRLQWVNWQCEHRLRAASAASFLGATRLLGESLFSDGVTKSLVRSLGILEMHPCIILKLCELITRQSQKHFQ